ncbi:T9SS type A sorting domain-containing protein [Flavobacterium zepuense]|uniref:T9SS type A sorting domain-containing protein n=1 Tax=Flavobacterium zepuense TaxID=2593302 RepID=A0A552UWF3_9FLAO|nr:T9SS type A sorting domain-containing protein [Flavobacterium zepuense]TRW22546.1 T9SS type A sorting domain-containing protein [Flavobacterium zepuense]
MKKIIILAVLFSAGATALAQCIVPQQVPYIINAEAAQVPELPECVTTMNTTFASPEAWETASGPVAGFTGNVLRYNTVTEFPNAWVGANLSSAPVHLAPGTYSLSYKYGMGNANATLGNMYVSIILPGSLSAPINIATHTNATGSAVTVAPISFTIATEGDYYVSFEVGTEGNQGFMYLDDIALQESDCGSPTNLQATNITGNSVTLSWDSATGGPYEYFVSNTGWAPASGTATTATTATFTGLQAQTFYIAYVRSQCNGAWSAWTQVTFTTGFPLSVKDNVFAGVVAYPNPVKDKLNLINATDLDKAEIYTLTGQLVATHSINNASATVLLKDLSTGIYLLTLHSGQQQKTIRLIKE